MSPSGADRTKTAGVTSLRRRLPSTTESARALVPLAAAILALGVFATIKSENFLTLQNFQNIFQELAVLGILAVGATLLMVAGQLDLSVGSGVSLLSIIGAKMIVAHWSQGIAIVAMLALSTAIGLVTGIVVASTRVQPFIVTLGALSVLAGLALIVSQTRPVPVGLNFSKLSLDEWGPFPVPALLFGGLCIAGALLLRFTKLGRYAYAIGSNEEAAFLAGVPIARTKIMLYGINGCLVGVGALMLLARLGSGDPNAGIGLELKAITAVVLGGATLAGGRGTMLGAFLGVFMLAEISNALNIVGVPNTYEQLVYGGVLVVAVVWAAVNELRRRSAVPVGRQLAAALERGRARLSR